MMILVCGDRHFLDFYTVNHVLNEYHDEQTDLSLIHGGASGADALSAMWAEENSVLASCYLAQWHRHGRAAGPKRNQEMIDARPDLVIAFHYSIESSNGTVDAIRRAKKAGIEVRLIGNEFWR